uniref:Uncharacterized protein n=1 Tax=Panagrolaimus sp. ES5 TaxID=591445 RepID=A0AC34GS37_9BILA
MDKDKSDDQQPTTSSASVPVPAPSYIETIESFARANNLTLISIQNMIYHIITDTDLFASLVESNKQALPHLRLTRSKWKEIQQKVETNVEITLNPVEAPRTFLDIEYNENDEDEDPEYIPDHFDNDIDFQFLPDELFEDTEPVYYTNTDSNYVNFLNSINVDAPFELDDDENDEDFHIPSPCNNELSDPEEEFINDQREMQDLWKAFDINMDIELERCRSSLKNNDRRNTLQAKNLKTPPKEFKIVPDTSVSLFGEKPLKITVNQKAMIEEHLAQHLQLLVQSIVGCHGNADLHSPYNQSILMLNELSTLLDKFDTNSSLKLPNINSALQLVNDFYDEKPEVMNPPLFETKLTKTTETDLRVQWALATCDAILFPDLLLSPNFSTFPTKYSLFLPSERALLTLGLIIFKKVPLANANNTYGKYQLISRYFLPNKTSNQIRVQILHTRERYSDNFSKVLTAAFHGAWIVETELLIKRLKAENVRPVDWPYEFQPPWLREISKYRRQFCDNGKKLSIFAVKDNKLIEKMNQYDKISIIKCASLPDDYQLMDSKTSNADEHEKQTTVTISKEKNIRSSVDDEVSCQSGKSGGGGDSKTNDLTTEASNRISSKQRRYDNLIKTLNAAENKEKSFYGIVAAVQADINEQFFMHEEKLRQFRKIISSPGKLPSEVIEELKILLDEKDYELIFLLATLLDPSNFDDKFCDSAEFRAIQSAVEMLKGIQTYLYITRGLKTVRKLGTWFRNQSNEDMEKLQGILKTLFRRDQKIYRLFVGDDLEAKIPDDRFEVVDLSKPAENEQRSEAFEVVEIPYKRPRYCSDRPQPQIHHGSIIFEKNGIEKALEIRSSNDKVISWSAASDLDLLKTLTRYGTNFDEAAEAFCRQPAHANISVDEAKSRLLYLQSTTE